MRRRVRRFGLRTGVLVCLVLLVSMGLAAWRSAPAPDTVAVVQPVDYALTAECLAQRQSWRNFTSTLAELEHDLRFCVEVWPAGRSAQP